MTKSEASRGPTRYGKYYWCVKVPEEPKEIYANADKIEIGSVGELILWGREDIGIPNLIFAPGQWLICFAASCLDDHPIAVERREGEVDRDDVIEKSRAD